MTNMNGLKDKLTSILARVGDCYGQESANDGVLHEVAADTITEAVRGTLGPTFTIIDRRYFDEFQRFGEGTDGHDELMALIKEHPGVEYAAVGDPDYFDPNATSSPGGFHFCFLFRSHNAKVKNLLVTFRCAMT